MTNTNALQHNNTERMDRVGSFRIPDETYAQLERVAAEDERPVSYIVRKAIEAYLESRAA